MTLSARTQRKLRHFIYGTGFFLNASLAISAYINSSFLENFVSEKLVGLIYAGTYFLTLIAVLTGQKLIERHGLRRTIVDLALLNFVAAAGLTMLTDQAVSLFFLVEWLIASFLLSITLDLYLEHLSRDQVTGTIRGVFLTLINLAWLLSPLLASTLNHRYGFAPVYLISSLLILPLILIAQFKLREIPPPKRFSSTIWHTIRSLWHAHQSSPVRHIRRILALDFLLNFFYALMIIYMPIYLHQHIGFSWEQIGLVLTIMLIPFVVLDLILGRLADQHLGEKEGIIAGLIIMGIATIFIPFITIAHLWTWALALFLTRIGAATLEIMKESYLFKNIDAGDVNVLLLSRSMPPLSYIIAPLLASLIMIFAPLQTIFTVLGIVMLLGLPIAFRLKDTR